MEKRKTGNAPFYAAMAVCLLAAGVGTWQLLRPAAGRNAVSAGGREAVSTVSQLPAQTAPALPAAASGGGTGGQADAAPVSGAAEVPKEQAVPSSDTAGSGNASAPASGGNSADAGGSPGGGNTSGSGSGSSGSGGSSGGNTSGGENKSGGGSGSDSGSGAKSGSEGGSGGSTSSGGGTNGGKEASSAVRTSPLDGTAVAAFSMERLQYNETLGDWRTHDGLDITADLGTAVAAACAGTVASVTEDPLMGVTVTLQHAGGYETTYAGLQETSRETGDEIPAGGIVGTVGDTAAAEAYLGPHLHFSVRHSGVPMDPEEFLSGA